MLLTIGKKLSLIQLITSSELLMSDGSHEARAWFMPDEILKVYSVLIWFRRITTNKIEKIINRHTSEKAILDSSLTWFCLSSSFKLLPSAIILST